MPPRIASLLTWSFVIWLFRRDIQQKPNVSGALWIPFFWFFIECSRPPSHWLIMLGLPVPGGASLDDGTPVDACFQFGVLIAGLCILYKRGASFGEFIRNNVWVAIFIGYCFLAVFWSDWTYVAFKRWIKDLDLPIMAMVVLTEADPLEAATRLIKRAAYVLLPVSVLFLKYYPQWGRFYSDWGGCENCGIALGKNFLGLDCLMTGFFFVWHLTRLLKVPRDFRDKSWRSELVLCVGFLFMVGWLFNIANSRTPLVCLTVGALVMLLSGSSWVRKEMIGAYLLGGLLLVGVFQMTFDVYGGALKLLGRNPTLTGRAFEWHDLLNIDINPVTGVGFESFWMGWQKKFPKEWERELNECHNGYLETYMTLGAVGVALLLAMLLAAYRNVCAELVRNVEWGRFRVGFFFAVVLYDWTESGFRGIDPIMQMFYIIALNSPKLQLDVAKSIAEAPVADLTPELANTATPP
ncbi:MAG TPA: O-antigen ligase family protein [Verrucomicrobiae bacterium]|nr:O-antigen ligase family protein [Verrucomicrobiae bacterium]